MTFVLKPALMATNGCLISSPSLYISSQISCSRPSLSIPYKPIKIHSLFSVKRKESLFFRVSVVATQEEDSPVILEEKEEIVGDLDWEAPEGTKVYVGNLPYDVDGENLAMLFSKAGVVDMAQVIVDRATEKSRGFGFVTMSSVEEAEKAVEMFSRYDLNGRLLTVNIAAPRGERPERNDAIANLDGQQSLNSLPSKSAFLRPMLQAHMPNQSSLKPFSVSAIRAHQIEARDGSAVVCDNRISDREALKVKEWEVGMLEDEVAASQGIKIRRRPPTGAPLHYVGPLELRLSNEGNTPRDVLEEIIWYKDLEVSQMKESKPLSMLKNMVGNAPPPKDFVGALKAAYLRTGVPGLIAEVKKASPSRGVLREDFDPVEVAKAYEKGGAACLSVLTDQKFFQGCFENLEYIRNSGVQCPLLCKEFVVDVWQIYYARVKGASAILLIAAVLSDLEIEYMIKICKSLGLAALVEVHDEREMDRVLEIDGIELVGINNRDLGTFKVDIGNTKKLLEGERGERLRQKDIIVVGESGLFTPADIAYVQEAGVKAVLVGESIVKQKDPTAGIAGLFGKSISA